MKWEKVKLGDISTSIQTGPFGSQLHQSDYSETGIPVVMPKDLIQGKISEESIARVSESHVERLNRHKIIPGDILYSRRGDVGRCAFATEYEKEWLCGTGCLRVTIDRSVAEPKYVFYQLQKVETIGWVINHAIGATMLNLNTSILSEVPISMPDLKTQRKIIAVLDAYDDLIENNQQQIKLLEEAAQRLYQEWFVKLKFPGWEKTRIVDGVPEGWSRQAVAEVLETVPRTKQILTSEYQMSGKIPIIDQSRDFVAGYTDDLEACVDLHNPVIVFGDHTRILKYVQFPFAKGADGTQVIISSNPKMPQPLLYCCLMNVDLSNYHYARHFKYLKAEEILVPTNEIATSFANRAGAIFGKIQNCRNIITQAQQARDRLLPKLMSGEMEV